jgi:LCP family protein required for cell wall assembly
MTNDEFLIRQAVAEEANQAVDPSTVLAALREGRRPRRRGTMLVAVAGFAVAAAVVAVVVPLTATRDASAPPAGRVDAVPPPTATAENILLVGKDDYTHTDSILLVQHRPDGSFHAVSLPRDAWVAIPGHGDNKLNAAYALGGKDPNSPEFDPNGAKTLVATVEGLTGVKVDHYAMVDMAGFGKLSTAIGGVEVCLKAASKDTSAHADFPAGKQMLTGDQLLAFLRQRHGLANGDLDRVVRQQVFLKALITKVAGTKNLDGLLQVVQANVRVDQSWNVVEFANQLVAGAAVDLATIPYTSADLRTPDNGAAIGVDPGKVKTFVADFFASKPAAGSSAPGTQDPGCVN